MSKKMFVSELEFDEIKNNLKSFMSAQNEFTDYNFEGSGLSVLLDVLAYNTHYNALYDNMLVNESFLDSAVKRESVVSRALDLGYIPRSAKTSKTTVNLQLVPQDTYENPPAFITVPAYSAFVSNTPSTSYTFYNPQTIVTRRRQDGNFYADNIPVVGGKNSKIVYTYENESTRFIIPNQNCDVDTIKVLVFDSGSASSRNYSYSRATSILDVKGDSRVYWIKEIDNLLYELRFGDDVIGKALQPGNLVVIDYLIAYGSETNGIRSLGYGGPKTFTYDGNTTINIEGYVTLVSPTYGGAEIESIDSIKFNAPRSYTAQTRAVTAEDYRSLVLSKFSDAQSVSVWGGEDNDPPEYGKVFVCVSQQGFKKLTPIQKLEIQNIIKARKVVTVSPVILDSEYIEIMLDVFVYYNERETTRSPDEIHELVLNTIFNYNDTTLEKFDGIFRYSKLTKAIDDCEKSIINSNMNISLRREVQPKYNVFAEYTLNMINPIKPGSISSTGLYIEVDENLYYLDDDENGKIRLCYFNSLSEKIIRYDDIGTVDYTKGIIKLRDLNVVAIDGLIWYINFEPSSKDVVSALTQIARIVEEKVVVTVLPDKTSIGDMRGGYNYNFT